MAGAADRPPPCVLSIAGSDPSSGAGVQADLATCHELGAFGVCAVTAITVQNSHRVSAVHPVPVAQVIAQVAALCEDFRVGAVKLGMLATAETAAALAEELPRLAPHAPVVLDPVMKSSSGADLLEHEGRRVLLEALVPLSTLVTPNLAESEELTGVAATDPAGMKDAARYLVEHAAAGAVLVTGGHLAGTVQDVLFDHDGFAEYRSSVSYEGSVRGTGCRLSTAIATGLARGLPLREAIAAARAYMDMLFRERVVRPAGGSPFFM